MPLPLTLPPGTAGPGFPPRALAGSGQQGSPPYIAGLVTSSGGKPGWFTDQYGRPRMVLGDAAWALLPNSGRWNSGNWQSTLHEYVHSRAAQGYTVIYTDPLGSTHNGGIADDGRHWDGQLPFTSTSPVTLNEVFWQRLDALIDLARAYGLTVFMNFGGSWDWESSGYALTGFTNTQAQQYGAAVASRYLNRANLFWTVEDDYFGTIDTKLDALHTGIRGTGDTRPMMIENMAESTSRTAIDGSGTMAWGTANSQFDFVYTYAQTYIGVEVAHTTSPPIPVIWGDGYFYQSTGSSYFAPQDRPVRQDAWWALTSGARGWIPGDDNLWQWGSSAASQVTTPFWPNHSGLVRAFFEGLPHWWLLVPDTTSALITGGRGTHGTALPTGGSGGQYEPAFTDSYVSAALTPDGTLGVAYCPNGTTITIDQSQLVAGYLAYKVDPITTARTQVPAAATYNTSSYGTNSQGDPDWALLFLAPSGPVTYAKDGAGASRGLGTGTIPLHEAGAGMSRGLGGGAVQVNHASGAGTVTYDATGPGSAGYTATATPYQWSHVVAADATLLVACVASDNDGGTVTVTAGGTSMTTNAGSTAWKRHSNDQTAGFEQLFVLPAPPTGTITIAISGATSGDRICAGSMSFKGTTLDATAYGTPVSAAGDSASASVSVTTTASSNMVAAAAAAGQPYDTVSGTSTSRFNVSGDFNSAAGNAAGQTAPATGGSVAVTRAITGSDWWAIVAIEAMAASGAPAFIEYKKGGGALSRGAGKGSKTVVSTVIVKTGAGMSRGTGKGTQETDRVRAGGGVSRGTGTGVRASGPPSPRAFGGTVSTDNGLGGTATPSTTPGGALTVAINHFGGTATAPNVLGGTGNADNGLGGTAIPAATPGGALSVTINHFGGTVTENTMQEVDIALNSFNDMTVSFTITSSGSPFNLTGYTVNMFLKPSRGVGDNTSGVLKLSSGGGSPAITVTDAAGGACTALIAATSLTPGAFSFYRVDVVSSGNASNTAIFGTVAITAL